jgi:ABC-type uncharacterized transport system involved in gliding motility auxiliary subunit
MAADAIAQAVGAGLNLLDSTVGSNARARQAEKQGFQDTQSRLLQIRQQREDQKQRQMEQRARTNRLLILVGGVVLSVLIIVLIVYSLNKKS